MRLATFSSVREPQRFLRLSTLALGFLAIPTVTTVTPILSAKAA